MIINEKSLNISDDKEKGFDDYINFYVVCLLLGENEVYEILKIGSGERRLFINNHSQSPSRESSFSDFKVCRVYRILN